MKKLTVLLLAVGFFLCLSHSAYAMAINYTFSGTVTEIFGPEYQPGSVGDTFTGYLNYVYDPDLDPNPYNPDIYPFIGSYFFELNGFQIQSSESSWKSINEAHDPDPSYLSMYDETPICYPQGYDVIDGFSISLNIPFSTGSIVMESGDDWFGSFDMSGVIDSISVSVVPVPEPATLLLFCTGLVGLAGLRNKCE